MTSVEKTGRGWMDESTKHPALTFEAVVLLFPINLQYFVLTIIKP